MSAAYRPVDGCPHANDRRVYWQLERRDDNEQRLDLVLADCADCGTTHTLVAMIRQTFGELSGHELSVREECEHRARRRASPPPRPPLAKLSTVDAMHAGLRFCLGGGAA